MKKLALTAVAAATMLAAGAANAYTSGTFSNGFVVPNVVQNGEAFTTAVGITNAGEASAVHWTFFDEDSEHVIDGCFEMTKNDYHQFVWSHPWDNPAEGNPLTLGQSGYLVFAAGASADCSDKTLPSDGSPGNIGAHAFQVDTVNDDVAFTPVIDGSLTIDPAATPAMNQLGPDSVTNVAGAANVGETLYMHYFIEGGADTSIVVWSTGDHSGKHTVDVYNDDQISVSTNFTLENEEQDRFDIRTALPRGDFTDGFVLWNTGNAEDLETGGSIFSYSVISAPGFNAVQSVLGLHTN